MSHPIPFGNLLRGVNKIPDSYTGSSLTENTICSSTDSGYLYYTLSPLRYYNSQHPFNFSYANGYFKGLGTQYPNDWVLISDGHVVQTGSCGPQVVSIELVPSSNVLEVGKSFQYTVYAHYSDNSIADVTSESNFYSTNSQIASIGYNTGLATANSVGSTQFYAEYSAFISSYVDITVVPEEAVITSISVVPTSFSVEEGKFQQLTVIAHWSDSTATDVTTSSSYSATNSNIIVNSSGLVTGITPGNSIVNISYQGHFTSSSVTVTAAPVVLEHITVSPSSFTIDVGTTRQLTVTAYYSDDSSSNVTNSAVYTTSNGNVTVSNTGFVTGINGGETIIYVSYGGKQVSSSVIIEDISLESIKIFPESSTLNYGQTLQLTVIGYYSNSSSTDLTTQATYSSNNPGVSVSSTGLVSSNQELTSATITASYGGFNSQSIITINEAPITSIEASPNTIYLQMNAPTAVFKVVGHSSFKITDLPNDEVAIINNHPEYSITPLFGDPVTFRVDLIEMMAVGVYETVLVYKGLATTLTVIILG